MYIISRSQKDSKTEEARCRQRQCGRFHRWTSPWPVWDFLQGPKRNGRKTGNIVDYFAEEFQPISQGPNR
jgi:hypothetical protein